MVLNFSFHVHTIIKFYLKIQKIGTPKIITVIILKIEQFGFLVQKFVDKKQMNGKQHRP